MSRRVDLVTLGVAIAVHAGLALGIARGRATPGPRTSTVELDYHDPPPAPAPAAAGPPAHAARPPAAHRRVALRERPAPAAPSVPERAASPAPAPKPMFAVAMASTSEVAAPADAPAAVSTTPGRPGRGLPGGHGAAGSAPGGGDGGGGAAESDVARMPEVDADACGRAIAYPAEAEQAGIEGDVRLRVALTAEGRVSAVRVLSGLGHGLDQAATDALRTRCRFSPALDRTGKPVAFVIRSYTFHFQLPGR